ncbi:adenylosuccinate lyase [Tissierella sp. P1]|uniref:adenylosuccinate lyase n=1 Tax=Tissierella sp. P1 TaxID=1280483 RepID=UPI002100ED0E|nr:adenylosuccinate lyase [Tissierella sp. P1]
MYNSPFSSRYSSKEMRYIFSDDYKYQTWRKLWIVLAESQMELGLDVSLEQVEELKKEQFNINYQVVEKYEDIYCHDVIAHIMAYGLQCAKAKPIIHLGATSCFITDNTDIIIIKEGLILIRNQILKIISELSNFAKMYIKTPTLSYTHLKPAQLTTVGKRTTLWIYDLLIDLLEINDILSNLKLLGSKGTTGTQASFLALFDNDHNKVKRLDELITTKLGFKESVEVCGQTYSRKFDTKVMNALCNVAQSSAKFSNDIRFLHHLKEIEEPFKEKQIGSSAMPYKKNPIGSERICGLARFIISNNINFHLNFSSQWLERTLDDSSNRRLCIPQMFLALDTILDLYINIINGLKVNEDIILSNVLREMPYIIMENLIVNGTMDGGDRQELHKNMRDLSNSISNYDNININVKDYIVTNILKNFSLNITYEELSKKIKRPEDYIGRSVEQVEEFLENHVELLLSDAEKMMI